jgi:hypothetical protein
LEINRGFRRVSIGSLRFKREFSKESMRFLKFNRDFRRVSILVLEMQWVMNGSRALTAAIRLRPTLAEAWSTPRGDHAWRTTTTGAHPPCLL